MTEPNSEIIKYLAQRHNDDSGSQILEITMNPDKQFFPPSTRSLLWPTLEQTMSNTDPDTRFEFTYVFRVLEKLQNPQKLLDFLKRHSSHGYIELSSPLAECLYLFGEFRGLPLSRFVIWVSDDHVLHVLPKYNLFNAIRTKEGFEEEMTKLLQMYPHYQYGYYEWSPEQPLEYVLYEHGVNFDLFKDYSRLLEKAIEESVHSTNSFLGRINDNVSVNKLDDSLPAPTEDQCNAQCNLEKLD